MRWEDTCNQTCSVARATSIFGDRWTLLVLRLLFLKVTKFSDIQQTLGITKHRLTDRLNRLIEEEIVYKHLYDETYKRYEYRLTEKGIDLYAVMIVIGQWGDKWLSDGDGVPVEYVHKNCGQNANPALTCSCCGEKLTASSLTLQMGSGLQKKLENEEINKFDEKLYANVFGWEKK